MNGLISFWRITVSPRHKALPFRSTSSKEKACGTNMKDSALLPNTTGWRLVRDLVAVHTLLITLGVESSILANSRQSSDG
jgi:hypothetical protein